MTGKPSETYKNGHMENGKEMEPLARAAYSIATDNEVTETGVIVNDQLWAACSPDGLIGMDGGLELKSVIPTTQVETIIGGKVPPEHCAQIQGNLWLSERDWWDFGSYCLEMPMRNQLFVIRVKRDEEYIRNLALEVAKFNEDAERLIELMGRVPMSNLEAVTV
jgi:hypothetical protein